jgi:phosphoglycolate phosphatase
MTRAAAVLFDLDGTLADTLADITGAMNGALALVGCPPRTAEEYQLFVGDGVEELVRRSLPKGYEDRLQRCMDEYRRLYAEHYLDETRPYPGIPEILAELGRLRVPLAVLSNKPDDTTRLMAVRFFGGAAFVAVAGERAGVPRKPDPTVARGILAAIGAEPAQSLFVGDSGIDMLTGARAGMIPVGVLWGFRGRAELERNGARAFVARPEELLPLVCEVPA